MHSSQHEATINLKLHKIDSTSRLAFWRKQAAFCGKCRRKEDFK